MKLPLRLSASFALPLELVTESVAIIARKRAGKSYTARKLAEQLHQAGQQLVIVDPKGDWWGIRSSADGKAAGLPIVILGGEHGDVPLEEGAGELVARMVVVDRVSVLLDLSELRKHQVTKFMTAFLETIYRLKAKEVHRTPVMVLIDEADAIAPQRPMPDEARMLGAAEDIVRRGGQRGIGVTLITQRAAVLNKNVLTQTSILVALVTTGSIRTAAAMARTSGSCARSGTSTASRSPRRARRPYGRRRPVLEAALAALDGEPKRNIIRTLVGAGVPLSREELAEKLGLHPNGRVVRGEPRLAPHDGPDHRARADRGHAGGARMTTDASVRQRTLPEAVLLCPRYKDGWFCLGVVFNGACVRCGTKSSGAVYALQVPPAPFFARAAEESAQSPQASTSAVPGDKE